MSTTVTAGFYIIKQDEYGNILVFIPAPEGEKNKPVIIYDGKEHALLVRNPEQNIILDYINPDIRAELSGTKEAIVVEVEGESVTDSYELDVRHVEEIPVQWENYGLGKWEDAFKKSAP